jgi:hypothetical protein
MSHDAHREFQRRALTNVRHLVDKLEVQELTWRTEKKIILILGVLVVAMAGFVGIAMVFGSSKEKDLERHRCEMEKQVAFVWEFNRQIKAERPNLAPGEVDAQVDAKRAEFKEAAKRACAGK